LVRAQLRRADGAATVRLAGDRGRPRCLIAAPTGSGKTFAAFLAAIDGLIRQSLDGTLRDETQVLYVSPLKALSADIQKNLTEPLERIREAFGGGSTPTWTSACCSAPATRRPPIGRRWSNNPHMSWSRPRSRCT
jgi:ATP-dependent Lhr-like helicase